MGSGTIKRGRPVRGDDRAPEVAPKGTGKGAVAPQSIAGWTGRF